MSFFFLALYLFGFFFFYKDIYNQYTGMEYFFVLIFLGGCLSSFLFGKIIEKIGCGKKSVSFFIFVFFSLLYVIAISYHKRVGTSFEFALLADNFYEIFHKESVATIKGTFVSFDYYLWAIFVVLLFFIEIKFKFFTKRIENNFSKNLKDISILIPIYLMIIVSPLYLRDELTYIFQTAFQYYKPVWFDRSQFETKETDFLRNKEFNFSKIDNDSSPQFVFLILMESLNYNFIDKKNEEGIDYTPFLNSLLKEGLYLKSFYGNSVQTAKGHFATLCSRIPLTRGKAFFVAENNKIKCLPEILSENDIETHFYQGSKTIDFDNTGPFWRKHGFKHIHAMDSNFVGAEEFQKYYWGWGVQDDLTYRKVFEKLDKTLSINTNVKNINNNNSTTIDSKKHFVVIASISHHMNFDNLPQDQWMVYKHPKNKKDNFSNSIRASDEYLKSFFDELNKREYLKNSVVIITADHSFPAGEHGIFQNQIGFYNESFRIPFLIIEPTNKKSKLVPKTSISEKKIFSQLDIAPTVLDLFQINASTAFLGDSIFKLISSGESFFSRFIYLVQPYDGKNLAIIKYPYKFISHGRSGHKFLFNLEDDIEEKNNLIDKFIETDNYSEFNKQLDVFFYNDELIRADLLK